jgi:hypothetical protein
MPDFADQELVDIGYERIVDRTEGDTCFHVCEHGPVWVPNAQIQEIRELAQTFRVPEQFAREKGLVSA